jgi:hypothetical protein
MVLEDIRKIKSGRRELRRFGLTIGIALAAFGFLFWWRGRGYSDVVFVVSAVFLILSFAAPVLLKPLQKGWMTLAILLGWVMTRVILCVLFYLVVTPIGAVSRLCGKDFLALKFDRDARSYWVPKDSAVGDRSRYEKQF